VPGIYAARTSYQLNSEDQDIAESNGRFVRRPDDD
jgi:hypothetical protein